MTHHDEAEDEAPRQYTWPWILLAFVILGIVLSVVWMWHEVQRVQRIRDMNPPRENAESPVSSAFGFRPPGFFWISDP